MPPLSFEDTRKQFPQYEDLSDEKLAAGIHKKFYPDLPFDEVARKIGYTSDPGEEVDTTTGLTNLPVRASLSFIDDPEHAEQYLGKFYESGRLPDGRLFYKNPETNKKTIVDEQGRSLGDLADWVGMIPEIGYGTMGAVAGFAVPAPGAAIVGAGVGTAMGKFVKKQVETGLLNKKPNYNPTDAEIKDYLASGVAGGAGEAVGGAIVKTLTPFAKNITPLHKRAIAFFEKYGGKLTPAQATENRLLDTLEGVVESSMFGGSRFREFRLAQGEKIISIADDIIEQFGNNATPEEAGLLVQKAIEGKRMVFNKTGQALYKEVDKLAGGAQISTVELKKEALKMLEDMVPKVGEKTLVPSLQNKTTVRILNDFAKLPDEVPFAYLQQWRSDLMQVGFAPSDLIPGKTAGTAKHLSKTIDNLFSKAEGGLTGEPLDAFRAANSFWKSGKEEFNNALIKGIAKKDPELISKSIFKPGAIQPIRKIKELVGDDVYRKIRGNYTNNLIFGKQSVSPLSGVPDGTKILTQLRGMGKPTLKEIYTKAEREALFDLGNTLRLIQKRPPGTGGGMLIQLVQAQALLSVPAGAVAAAGGSSVGGAISGTGVIALVGPVGLARLFTNPMGIKWLTKGLVTRRGSKEGIKVASRIVALAGKENLSTPRQPKEEFSDEPIPVSGQ